jgi:NAD(P)H-hydrate epimerase
VHFGFDATVVYPVRSAKTHFVNLVRQCEDVGIPVLDGMPDVATAAEAAAEAHDDDARGGSGTARPRAARYDVIVDAVFGFSFRGGSAPREPHASAISAMRDMRGRDDSAVVLVSVDVPSGWDVDGDGDGDGSTAGDRLVPDVLVSLTAPKPFARGFRGRHFVGGRFLPPALAEKYGIRVSGVGPFSPLRNAT